MKKFDKFFESKYNDLYNKAIELYNLAKDTSGFNSRYEKLYDEITKGTGSDIDFALTYYTNAESFANYVAYERTKGNYLFPTKK